MLVISIRIYSYNKWPEPLYRHHSNELLFPLTYMVCVWQGMVEDSSTLPLGRTRKVPLGLYQWACLENHLSWGGVGGEGVRLQNKVYYYTKVQWNRYTIIAPVITKVLHTQWIDWLMEQRQHAPFARVSNSPTLLRGCTNIASGQHNRRYSLNTHVMKATTPSPPSTAGTTESQNYLLMKANV